MMLKCHRPWMKNFAVVAGFSVLIGCGNETPRPSIVTNHTEMWEEQLVRERREREMNAPPERPHVVAGEGYGFDEKDKEDKHSVVVTTLADIFAFPLRGAAWLAHTLL